MGDGGRNLGWEVNQNGKRELEGDRVGKWRKRGIIIHELGSRTGKQRLDTFARWSHDRRKR